MTLTFHPSSTNSPTKDNFATSSKAPPQPPFKRAPSSTLFARNPSPTLDIISAIHPHLLDILRSGSPTLLLRVSKAFYDDLLPALYANLELSRYNIGGVLEGIDMSLKGDRKRDALDWVRNLVILDIKVLDRLLDLVDPHLKKDEGQKLEGSIDGSNHTLHLNVNLESSTSAKPLMLFPNLESLYLPFNILQSLNDLTLSSSELTNHDHGPLGDVARERRKRKLSEYSIVFTHLIKSKKIHFEFNQEIDSFTYWSFDHTLTKLFKNIGISNNNNEINDVNIDEDEGKGRSLESGTEFIINTILPLERPESAYIPHNLCLKSSIHFITNRQDGEDSKVIMKNEDLAKVIRGHYDVHTSRETYPPIYYYITDLEGVMEELNKFIERGIRVDQRLLLPEEDGGISRLEMEREGGKEENEQTTS